MIRVENLSKRYMIGHQRQERYVSLRDVIADKVKSFGGLFSRNGKVEDPTHEDFWALKDVSFEIKQGDRVGIIGRNGAGKSTLLKILSRITEPTSGKISIKGRVASLLEVGTGFHPELTGRENVYLNGAILGMDRSDIKRKFDEIVAFAEVEKFLDTPVKRYSSGMYVRLAFAVAAHLEPEILIVDEVLAVGDTQFQKKCLGKMEDVGKEGRTVLFVSHSMQAISQLTSRCILLRQGSIQLDGSTDRAVTLNLAEGKNSSDIGFYKAPVSKLDNYLKEAYIHTSEEMGIHIWGKQIIFEFQMCIHEPQEGLCFSFQIIDEHKQAIGHYSIFDYQISYGREAGIYKLKCEIPKLRLFMGSYTLTTWLAERRNGRLVENLTDICQFEVSMGNIERKEYEWRTGECAYIEDYQWQAIDGKISPDLIV